MSTPAAGVLHREVLRLADARQWVAAAAACRELTTRFPAFAAGWFAASRIALAQGTALVALEAVDRAVQLEPANPAVRLHRAHCLLALGRRSAALEAAQAAERGAARDPVLWDAIGTLASLAGDQRRALGAYDRAVALAPENPRFRYNRAAVRRFVGDLAGAEADYDQVIRQRPGDHEAHLNRSELRRQTAERNHVPELEAIAAHPIADWRGAVQIGYALAKEHEDLGQHARSFEHLARAAGIRRRHMQYDVGTDVATVDWIIEAYPGGALPRQSAGVPEADSPVFIVGLPRSGSTLVERILGSHSAVTAGGELDAFAVVLVDAARCRSGAAALPRRDLVALSAQLDFAALGGAYLTRARAATGAPARFTDKMPLNYLYCGLINRALPGARIVHVTRQPMAACYAIFKTLFKDGYPFSYDLQDLARYYAAYARLMAHWNATLPGVIHELRYEDLVRDQHAETRRLLGFCGLSWEDACADFHRNPAATTTASAAQVRQPIYDSSVDQWRHYAVQLAPLRDALQGAGIEVPPPVRAQSC